MWCIVVWKSWEFYLGKNKEIKEVNRKIGKVGHCIDQICVREGTTQVLIHDVCQLQCVRDSCSFDFFFFFNFQIEKQIIEINKQIGGRWWGSVSGHGFDKLILTHKKKKGQINECFTNYNPSAKTKQKKESVLQPCFGHCFTNLLFSNWFVYLWIMHGKPEILSLLLRM